MARCAKILLAAYICAVLSVQPAGAADKKFEASLDRSRIALGERAQLGLSFYGTQSMPAPDLGNADGLEIRYLGPSTMMTVLNGQVSSSITHMYTVQPLKAGKFQLGPYTFKFKGDQYTSNVAFLDVGEDRAGITSQPIPQAASVEQLDLADRIFVRLTADKTTAYINELIPITVKLYVNRLNVSDIQLPAFDQEGFSKIEFKEPKQYREHVQGDMYEVLEFKTSIFGTKPGDYRLGPAKIKCSVMVRKTGPRSSPFRDEYDNDPYRDSFFDDFFTRYERHPLELKSQDVQIAVLPLPAAGKPKDFTGAIGDYQFIFSASPTKVKVGDPVTVRMDINGNGNFNTVIMPVFENTAGFKVYEPQIKTEDNRKTFTQVLIPESDLVTQVPKASFTYFDTSAKQYKTITQGPVAIQVEKGKEEAAQVVGPVAPQVSAQGKDEELARDIIYIKDTPGPWIRKGSGYFRSPLFAAALFLPLVYLPALYVFQSRRVRIRDDAVYASRLAAYKSSRKGLKGLRHLLKGQDPKVFYEAFFKTLQDYLGYRLHIPPAGITSASAESALISRNVDPDVVRKVRNLFQACDMARFAYAAVDRLKMRDDLIELDEIVKYFERKKI